MKLLVAGRMVEIDGKPPETEDADALMMDVTRLAVPVAVALADSVVLPHTGTYSITVTVVVMAEGDTLAGTLL